MDRRIYIFVYGTLLRADVRQMILGNDIPVPSDILPGFQPVETKTSEGLALTLEIDDRCETVGEVLSLTPQKLGILDEYESPDYRRQEVKLKSGMTAWVYLRR